jgi:hypothetical protein
LIDFVLLRNVSGHSCSLAGAPAVTARENGGRVMRLRRVALDGDFVTPRVPVGLLAHPRHTLWSEAMVPLSVSGLTDAGQACEGKHCEMIRSGNFLPTT